MADRSGVIVVPEMTASQVPSISSLKMSLKLSPLYASGRSASPSRSQTARINSTSNPVATPLRIRSNGGSGYADCTVNVPAVTVRSISLVLRFRRSGGADRSEEFLHFRRQPVAVLRQRLRRRKQLRRSGGDGRRAFVHFADVGGDVRGAAGSSTHVFGDVLRCRRLLVDRGGDDGCDFGNASNRCADDLDRRYRIPGRSLNAGDLHADLLGVF